MPWGSVVDGFSIFFVDVNGCFLFFVGCVLCFSW